MFFSAPAQSAIFRFQVPNGSNYPIVGNRAVLGNSSGNPLNLISFNSPEFPTSQIANNNTSQVSISSVGGLVLPGDTYTLNINIEDNPDGTAVLNLLEAASLVATPTGIQEQAFPTLTTSSSTSPGAKTSFSAFRVRNLVDINGKSIVLDSIYQVPGDQLSFSGLVSSSPLTFSISSQPIAGYVPFDQLNDFSSPVEYTLQPGGSISVTNPQGSKSVPEPNLIGGLLLGIGFAAFFKRNLFNSNTKASRKLLANFFNC
ncbi:MAG: PEP-CTERM sorting domain-containing protein [Nostoc sp.]|uniref:PEP-CTERM sorting domain-containing protein n=1 Tax=Nostoc sp. TaxID=1180 RepID=UPI002FF72DE9